MDAYPGSPIAGVRVSWIAIISGECEEMRSRNSVERVGWVFGSSEDAFQVSAVIVLDEGRGTNVAWELLVVRR